jgi:hypothetical protein
MQICHDGLVEKTILQVRDVDEAVIRELKARAEAQGLSLSAFVRDLLAEEAALPSIRNVMNRIASREPVAYSAEDLRSAIEDGRT